MINTREVAKEYRLTHWAQIMQERAQRGLSIRAYCKEIGICENTYFYWQRRVRSVACEQLTKLESAHKSVTPPSFVAIEVAEPSSMPLALAAPPETGIPSSQLCVEVAGLHITADSAYPPDKLAVLLRELMQPC